MLITLKGLIAFHPRLKTCFGQTVLDCGKGSGSTQLNGLEKLLMHLLSGQHQIFRFVRLGQYKHWYIRSGPYPHFGLFDLSSALIPVRSLSTITTFFKSVWTAQYAHLVFIWSGQYPYSKLRCSYKKNRSSLNCINVYCFDCFFLKKQPIIGNQQLVLNLQMSTLFSVIFLF